MQNNSTSAATEDLWSSVYFNWYPSNALYVRRHYDWLAGPAVSIGTWHHVAVARGGDVISVYVDGSLAVSSGGQGTAGRFRPDGLPGSEYRHQFAQWDIG